MGSRQVCWMTNINIYSFPADFSTPSWSLSVGCMHLFCVPRPPYPHNALYCAQCILGTHHVWHSSRLFCFGRLPAPVLHLFAGPVWCGVNNIQTYTHALISIHSGRQCRTPSLLRGWHFGKGQIHLAKNLCLYPAHHVPRLSIVLLKKTAFVSSQNIHLCELIAVDPLICRITRANTWGPIASNGMETQGKPKSCVKRHVVRVISGRLLQMGVGGGGVEGTSMVAQLTRWPSEVWHAAPSPSKAWINQP